MVILVTGGSGSGKSEYAEERLAAFPGCPRIYLATMMAEDGESMERVRRHVQQRAGRDFETVECSRNLGSLPDGLLKGAEILLEDLSNLLANEMFASVPSFSCTMRQPGQQESDQDLCSRMLRELRMLAEKCADLVIVTNEVFSDGIGCDRDTERFMSCLGQLNRELAVLADEVVEVVYGIPVSLKKTGIQTEMCKEDFYGMYYD